ncbi:hypothetical protein LOC67_09045 [Stieleria sp. JC731]|uniref:hypothetical protein n=1 Tax=Pirellulaceae TaxID=2691357 RepID=UPI001E4A2813|nr:hypothetical protein [Stieleria sp. JC731]MCC9600708.1 hypothetical protein [Stieleria sp. JC731]
MLNVLMLTVLVVSGAANESLPVEPTNESEPQVSSQASSLTTESAQIQLRFANNTIVPEAIASKTTDSENPSNANGPSNASGLNIGFAYDPGHGKYDGAIGSPTDVWNFVSLGTTAIDYMRHPNAIGSTARLRVSRHDGQWAVDSHPGIFRGYIYDNCRCIDLEVKLLDLEPAKYRAYVYAHGDAPDQNASIELVVGKERYAQKATGTDKDGEFQSLKLTEGVHYVTFDFEVKKGEKVRFISHRDRSDYSMFNAIQLQMIP